jgi:hypothetical protein
MHRQQDRRLLLESLAPLLACPSWSTSVAGYLGVFPHLLDICLEMLEGFLLASFFSSSVLESRDMKAQSHIAS